MVKFRGIDISIISQFDILKLPEYPYRPTAPSPDIFRDSTFPPPSKSPTASCYVSMYPGSQIWFDYSIDGPHPPNAAYYFKLFLNADVLTSWDCTSKNGYHGKAMYILKYEGKDQFSGTHLLKRQILRFGKDDEDDKIGPQDNVMEIKIYRIEYRKRIQFPDEELCQMSINTPRSEGLKLVNGGIVEPGLPKRRYKYQLLDPLYEPYATFRFYYRSYDFLMAHGIIPGTAFSDSSSEDSRESIQHSSPKQPLKSIRYSPKWKPNETQQIETPTKCAFGKNTKKLLLHSDSDESLSIVTKDSVEELPSLVSRSPISQSPSKKKGRERVSQPVPPSPTIKSSPRHRLRKKTLITPQSTVDDHEPSVSITNPSCPKNDEQTLTVSDDYRRGAHDDKKLKKLQRAEKVGFKSFFGLRRSKDD